VIAYSLELDIITGLLGMTLKIEDLCHGRHWHEIESSLLKDISVKDKSKIAVLSPVMVTAAG
jgi:hypothetical protein